MPVDPPTGERVGVWHLRTLGADRYRVTSTLDVAGEDRHEQVVASMEEALEVLRGWLTQWRLASGESP